MKSYVNFSNNEFLKSHKHVSKKGIASKWIVLKYTTIKSTLYAPILQLYTNEIHKLIY